MSWFTKKQDEPADGYQAPPRGGPNGATCATCVFWRANDRMETDAVEGICRAHPPTHAILPAAWLWPPAFATDWCGEWEPVAPPQIHEPPEVQEHESRIPETL